MQRRAYSRQMVTWVCAGLWFNVTARNQKLEFSSLPAPALNNPLFNFLSANVYIRIVHSWCVLNVRTFLKSILIHRCNFFSSKKFIWKSKIKITHECSTVFQIVFIAILMFEFTIEVTIHYDFTWEWNLLFQYEFYVNCK